MRLLQLPTVDLYSAEVPGEMHSHTVLCGDLYICACVDASRTVFWDRSHGTAITMMFYVIKNEMHRNKSRSPCRNFSNFFLKQQDQ